MPTDLSESQTSSEDVEVRTFGTVTVRPYQQADRPSVAVALHGVQRVDGATVVYYSMGYTGEELDPAGLSEISGPGASTGNYSSGGALGSVRLVDTAGGQVYRTVVDPEGPEGPAAQPFSSKHEAFPQEGGVMGVAYAVLPELPASTETVDVDLVFGVTIPDVPVQEGYLEPTADPGTVIPLGTGWPQVQETTVADIDPDGFVFPLSAVTEALDDSQVVTEEGETVTIDLAADVLFAFDEAELSAAAQAKLAEITQKLTADQATGAVSIVGHTDSQGSDSYNVDLSRRRAQSVAAVLTPALSGQSLTFDVDGKGEAEPVADNGSDEGRQANRRVTITYTTGRG
ncbi:MAG: OmpA family protein [Nocardioides sp.]|nr:OmpA family protein [Nocardioides sp.]